ncbi:MULTISPECIES: hypothetical protein [Nocardiopsis]|uniref:Uncharacterized protein n=1 Tax=Nocardiopsis sinuspersici TaxID=501010 RepID=A0A1V3C6H5_9ACTN|nr:MULTISPECIES: hypothetical protein [Nocardiopsis]NYH52849.1 hypothetical protein [Nocardiopsis sinuspersici]OOC56242.1 hypothetical protein NOSIN_22440 [Nocardiopsis sinuspersici]
MTTTGVLEPTGPNRALGRTSWLDRVLATPSAVVERHLPVRALDGYERRPNPLDAETPAEFLLTMRRYLVWAGDWSYVELEYLCGGAVKRSTFQQVLEGTALPGYVFLMAFVTACAGEDAGERQRWMTAWHRLRSAGY